MLIVNANHPDQQRIIIHTHTEFDENRSPNDRLWCSQLNDNYKLLHCLSLS